MGSLVSEIVTNPADREEFRKLSFSAQFGHLRNSLYSSLAQAQDLYETTVERTDKHNTIIKKMYADNKSSQENLHRILELQEKTKGIFDECQAKLAEAQWEKEELTVSVNKLGQEKEEPVATVEKLTQELIDYKESTSILGQELYNKKKDLEDILERVIQWQNKTMDAVVDDFMNFYGHKNFTPHFIAPYVDRRIQALKEENFNVIDSDIEDEANAEYEELPPSEDPLQSENPSAQPPFPPHEE